MKKFMATKGNEIGDPAIEFEAKDLADAEQKLAEEGYDDYMVVWELMCKHPMKMMDKDGNVHETS